MLTINNVYKAKSISYGSKRKNSAIKYLVYHYTGCNTDTAKAEAKYFATSNVRSAGAHYFVDDNEIYQSINDLLIAWSVGGNKYGDCNITGGGTLYKVVTNTNSISIEMCSKNGAISEDTIANAVELGKYLMAKYSIPIQNVCRHFDVVGKRCPGWNGWWGKSSEKWLNLKSRLCDNSVKVATPISPVTTTTLSCVATAKGVQEYLNKNYGTVITKVLGAKLSVDGSFGSKSKKALAAAFQSELNGLGAGLTIDGSFGKASETAFNTYVKKIRTGSKGIFVTLWQCLLVGFKCNVGSIDGSYGTKTKNATNELFKLKGLAQDYVVDGSDLNKLL